MRLFLFFGSIALSVAIVFTSLSEVRAEPQDASMDLPHSVQAHSVQATIEKQLKAFREKDADSAFSLISKHFQDQYRDASHFLSAMRFSHQPLSAHLSYDFMDQVQIGDTLIQKVEMLNPDGTSTLIMFRMRQNDKADWMVDGYTFLESDAQPI